MATILPPAKHAAIVSALTEGCSIRSTAHMVCVSRNTVTKLLLDLADACAADQGEHLVDLPCNPVQADEIWSFVYAKQKYVPAEKAGEFVDDRGRCGAPGSKNLKLSHDSPPCD